MDASNLEMFDCAPRRMRLSVRGCARLWRSAQENPPATWEGRFACRVCLVGAAHAGVKMSEVAAETERLRTVCSRCLGRTSRLINGRFCISCYNRHCEALRGRNARGSRPRLCSKLRMFEVAVSSGDAGRIETMPSVTGASEVLVELARRASNVTFYGWASKGPGDLVDLAA